MQPDILISGFKNTYCDETVIAKSKEDTTVFSFLSEMFSDIPDGAEISIEVRIL